MGGQMGPLLGSHIAVVQQEHDASSLRPEALSFGRTSHPICDASRPYKVLRGSPCPELQFLSEPQRRLRTSYSKPLSAKFRPGSLQSLQPPGSSENPEASYLHQLRHLSRVETAAYPATWTTQQKELPMDSEHKAKTLPLWTFYFPHMRCFHLSWVGFFVAFLSAYAAAPLVDIIRDDLNLRQRQINEAGVVTTAGTVFARILMGNICDWYGPRYGFAVFLCITASFVSAMASVVTAPAFIIVRLLIGFGLATFVSNQYWTSVLFTPSLVGIANAVAGGWGNAGGGATQIIMPYLTLAIGHHHPLHNAWRIAFFIPAICHIIMALLILFFGQDLPDGNFAELQKSGRKQKSKMGMHSLYILMNYRLWFLGAIYAYSFGVELALDNALAPYYTNNFGWSITRAGNLAAIFGLMNFISRPLGGVLSDVCARYYGMRGRLWALFFTLGVGGMGTAVMGTQHLNGNTTLGLMVVAGWFLEMTCGTTYAVVPFVSRRNLGVVCGLVSAGGAIGGVINQAIFFLNGTIPVYDGLKWMGVVTCGIAILCVPTLYWPMWGGMFMPARQGKTEEDYYFGEYTPSEREQGLHMASSAFAFESRSQRGIIRLKKEGTPHGMTAGKGDDVAHV
ncbi:hypothetical protein WJX73_007601 [Symbiochloris irregularis]|uniref:Major facilitator superfamily (MFS) profile domain-containing protein n=1 Tax=Symbiochloris irregularis TaxID=706552 RepID=A0AAW1PMG3_9CHLO